MWRVRIVACICCCEALEALDELAELFCLKAGHASLALVLLRAQVDWWMSLVVHSTFLVTGSTFSALTLV